MTGLLNKTGANDSVSNSGSRHTTQPMEVFSLPHTWTQDTRNPIFRFSLQGEDEYGLYLCSIPLWIELIGIIVLEACLAALFSLVVYYVVVRNPSTPLAYWTGFGVFIPFWIFAPGWTANFLSIRNKLFLFCICAITPNTSIFRVSEAIFGFTPDYAKTSAGSFALYFGCPM